MIDYDISYNRHNVSQLLLTYFLQIHTIQLRMMLLYYQSHNKILQIFLYVFFPPSSTMLYNIQDFLVRGWWVRLMA